MSGCAAPRAPAPPHPALRATADASPRPTSLSTPATAVVEAPGPHAGRSVEGRPIHVQVLGEGPRCVLLLASIHGNEAAGTPLLEQLARLLARRPELLQSTRVVIVPVLNPDGLAAGTRRNAQGVDLNRDYPSSNQRASQRSEHQPETRTLLELIERHEPELIVSIHGWMGLVDWDGPGAEVARAMGAACSLPARQLGARPGSLGSFLGLDGGLPVITLELPAAARSMGPSDLWTRFGPALLVAVRRPGHSS